MTRPTLRLLPALFVLAFAGAGCDINVGDNGFSMDFAAGKAQDEWSRTYTVAAAGRLEIVNVNGAITATPADGGQVEVRAERMSRPLPTKRPARRSRRSSWPRPSAPIASGSRPGRPKGGGSTIRCAIS